MNEDTMRELRQAADCAGLEMEFLDLAANAERYRKLRANSHVMTPRVCDPLDDRIGYTPEGLDAALDALPDVGAAMKEKP